MPNGNTPMPTTDKKSTQRIDNVIADLDRRAAQLAKQALETKRIAAQWRRFKAKQQQTVAA